MIAYITEQGAKIRREGERFLICGKDEQKVIFSHKLEQLVVFGNIHLTASARSLLLAKKIDTVFLSGQGSYRGRLISGEGENVFLRKRQYDLLDDSHFRLDVARAIVSAKLHNQTVMLERLKREQHLQQIESAVNELKSLGREANQAASVESLRGIEGRGATVYFHNFALAFHEDWGFSHRNRRPPADPVNVVLSLIYTLLADRCHTACRLAGLDPYPANLHTLEYGRQSLPLDLVEEFRSVFGDALTLSLFNKRSLKKEDFEMQPRLAQSDANSEDVIPHKLKLRTEAFRKVLGAFAGKMETEFHNKHADKKMTYAMAVNHQAMEYRRAVEGRVSYAPFLWH